jgi:hypothetical protein
MSSSYEGNRRSIGQTALLFIGQRRTQSNVAASNEEDRFGGERQTDIQSSYSARSEL